MTNHSKYTYFGHKQVKFEEKANLVKDVFSSVASKYDLMNDLMSLGIHRIWKSQFVKQIIPKPGMHLLDMAGGTGDIAFRYLKKTAHLSPRPIATVCDINSDMLNEGRARAADKGFLSHIHWCQANAEQLPFPDNYFDVYTIAFGLRNVTNISQALEESRRVLKPNGTFLCLEFSKVHPPFLNKLYTLYSKTYIPTLGRYIANDQEAYEYLIESIERFPDRETLSQILKNSGYSFVKHKALSNGIVAIHTAHKA